MRSLFVWRSAVWCAISLVPIVLVTLLAQHPDFDTNPLVGTWERVSLLRHSVSVQPPDAPLYLKLGADGYWSMMEMPDDRQRINKPLEAMTREELFNRFNKVEGGWGHYVVKGDVVNRIHHGNVAPSREGVSHIREYIFEGEIMNLAGMGPDRSPQARMRRLAAHPPGDLRLVGTWERTSLTLDGQATEPPAPEIILLGEDGWFSQTQLPTGREEISKALKEYNKKDYVRTFTDVEAARGTYTVDGNKFTRKHIANINPNLVGYEEVREFQLADESLTLRGSDPSGAKVEAKYRRLKPRRILSWSISSSSGYDLTRPTP